MGALIVGFLLFWREMWQRNQGCVILITMYPLPVGQRSDGIRRKKKGGFAVTRIAMLHKETALFFVD